MFACLLSSREPARPFAEIIVTEDPMTAISRKKFNTTGPCVPEKHYMLPVMPRLPDAGDMIKGEFYFILRAPRQSGKTTMLDVLTDKINSEGEM